MCVSQHAMGEGCVSQHAMGHGVDNHPTPRPDIPPPVETATEADDTHPTEMHSCLNFLHSEIAQMPKHLTLPHWRPKSHPVKLSEHLIVICIALFRGTMHSP